MPDPLGASLNLGAGISDVVQGFSQIKNVIGDVRSYISGVKIPPLVFPYTTKNEIKEAAGAARKTAEEAPLFEPGKLSSDLEKELNTIKNKLPIYASTIKKDMKEVLTLGAPEESLQKIKDLYTGINERIRPLKQSLTDASSAQKELGKAADDWGKLFERYNESAYKQTRLLENSFIKLDEHMKLVDSDLAKIYTKFSTMKPEDFLQGWKAISKEHREGFQFLSLQAAEMVNNTRAAAELRKHFEQMNYHQEKALALGDSLSGKYRDSSELAKKLSKSMEVITAQKKEMGGQGAEIPQEAYDTWVKIERIMQGVAARAEEIKKKKKVISKEDQQVLMHQVKSANTMYRQVEAHDDADKSLNRMASTYKKISSEIVGIVRAERAKKREIHLATQSTNDYQKTLTAVKNLSEQISNSFGTSTQKVKMALQIFTILSEKVRNIQSSFTKRGFLSEGEIVTLEAVGKRVLEVSASLDRMGTGVTGGMGGAFRDARKNLDYLITGLITTGNKAGELKAKNFELSESALSAAENVRKQATSVDQLNTEYLGAIDSTKKQVDVNNRYNEAMKRLGVTSEGYYGFLRKYSGMTEDTSSKTARFVMWLQKLTASFAYNREAAFRANTQMKGFTDYLALGLGKTSGVVSRLIPHFAALFKTIASGSGYVMQFGNTMVNFARNQLMTPFEVIYKMRQLFVRWYVTILLVSNMFRRLAGDILSFQKIALRATALSGDGFSEFNRIMDITKQILIKLPVSINSVGSALQKIAQAGYRGAEIPQIVEPAIRLAAVFGGELEPAIDVTIGTLKAFELDAEQAAYVINLLGNTAAETNITVDQLSTAMAYAGPAAVAFGASLEDTLTMVGLFRDLNISASRVGTNLRMGLTNLTQVMSQMGDSAMRPIDALKLLGIKQKELVEAEGDMIKIHKLFSESMRGMDNVTKQAALQALFGKRAYGAWSAFFSKNTEEIIKRKKSIEDLTIVETKASDLAEKGAIVLDRIKNAWALLRLEIVNALVPAFDGLGSEMEIINNRFSEIGQAIGGKLLPHIKSLMSWLAGLASGDSLGNFGNAIMKIFNVIIETAKDVLSAWMDIGGGIGVASDIVGAITNGIKLLGAYLKVAGIGVAMVVKAILWIVSSPLFEFIIDYYKIMYAIFSGIINYIIAIFSTLSNGQNVLVAIGKFLATVVLWAWNQINKIIKAIMPLLVTVGILIAGIWEVLKPVLVIVWDLLMLVMDIVLSLANSIGVLLIPVATALYGVLYAVSKILEVIVFLVKAIIYPFKAMFQIISDISSSVFGSLLNILGLGDNSTKVMNNTAESANAAAVAIHGVGNAFSSVDQIVKSIAAREGVGNEFSNPLETLFYNKNDLNLMAKNAGYNNAKAYSDGWSTGSREASPFVERGSGEVNKIFETQDRVMVENKIDVTFKKDSTFDNLGVNIAEQIEKIVDDGNKATIEKLSSRKKDKEINLSATSTFEGVI